MQLRAGLLIKWIACCRGHALWLCPEAVVMVANCAIWLRVSVIVATCLHGTRVMLNCEHKSSANVALWWALFCGTGTCSGDCVRMQDSFGGELTGIVPGASPRGVRRNARRSATLPWWGY